MSAFPPLNYRTPPLPAQTVRPVSVTVLAIIGIVLSSAAILNNGSWGIFVLKSRQFSALGPVSLRQWHVAELLISLAFGLFLLACCVGALWLRRWARKALLTYAAAYVAWLAVCIYVALWRTIPAMYGQAAAEGRRFGIGHEDDLVDLKKVAVGMMGIAAIYPITLLWFMMRPRVRAAFGSRRSR